VPEFRPGSGPCTRRGKEESYDSFKGFPLDWFLDTPMMQAAEGAALVRAQIDHLCQTGTFKAA
jgi:hypothetical protein